MIWIICIVIVFAILLFIIGVYNSIVSLKMRVKNGWAQINTQLKRRFDLIPNLVETVKSYSAYEAGTLEKVIEARNQYTKSSTVAETAAAENMLTGTLKSLFALAEAYPDLKANQNFAALQVELIGTEDKVAFARQFYNDTVAKYNEAILVFPNNIFAGMFNYTAEPFFEISNEAEKEAVKVQF